ncbi:MAG: ribulose-phosphate 3-epimerase [Candidatus Bipolaricaulota bacterium]|nr:ribulose-phosphate 3-epimerase [Candidatus Bipolaricaulota bacterium]
MKLSPSLLAADFADLYREAMSVAPLASSLHWDVMDGHFVPNLTFGPPVVNALRKKLDLPFVIHLMIDHPVEYTPQFDVRPMDTIIVHVESTDGADRALDAVQAAQAHAGISFRPATPIDRLEPYFDRVSTVLVMSVEPGFGGQSFLPDSLTRIRELTRRIGERPIEIAVDGGIQVGNVRDVVRAGADVIIAGSAVFGAKDRLAAMRQLLEAAR